MLALCDVFRYVVTPLSPKASDAAVNNVVAEGDRNSRFSPPDFLPDSSRTPILAGTLVSEMTMETAT